MLTAKWAERVRLAKRKRVVLPLVTIALSTFAIVALVNDAPHSVTTQALHLPPINNFYEKRVNPIPNDQQLAAQGIFKPPVRHYEFYNETKLAVIIERRNVSQLAPLLLHFISVVPPDWRFRLLGSPESIAFVNQSLPIQRYERIGKLDLFVLPEVLKTHSSEELSQTLTTPAFWSHILAPAKHMLMFQTDSILCANADKSLDYYMQYAYVGAPWRRYAYGGNGGLSLRRIDAMLRVLEKYERHEDSDPEDLWFSRRLKWVKGNAIAYNSVSRNFSVESVWNERPLGFHIGGSGRILSNAIWGYEDRKNHTYEYCPEIRMIMDMVLPWDSFPCNVTAPKKRRGLLTVGHLTPWML